MRGRGSPQDAEGRAREFFLNQRSSVNQEVVTFLPSEITHRPHQEATLRNTQFVARRHAPEGVGPKFIGIDGWVERYQAGSQPECSRMRTSNSEAGCHHYVRQRQDQGHG